MSNFLSYSQILKDRENFRKSGTGSGSEFNITDTPGSKYFKLFFYFDNGDGEGKTGITSTGLLSPTWLYDIPERDLYKYTSAWSYLKMNYEDERADLLVQFVNLLSNISSESPWYFSSITGLENAIERKQVTDHDFKFEDERQKISIKCLPDSYDNRIYTLLDLYRSITWSWVNKREILPSNLRKFDMGIMIFESVNEPFHYIKGNKSLDIKDEYADIGNSGGKYKTSYKYFEFHNCEIDYNSSKSAWSTIDNTTGLSPEFTIEISYDDCYEMNYNEFMIKEFGDFIEWDWDHLREYQEQAFNAKLYYGMSTKLNFYGQIEDEEPNNTKFTNNLVQSKIQRREAKKQEKFTKNIAKKEKEDWLINPIKNAVGQVIGTGINYGLHYLKRAVLGNLFTFSLTRMADQLKSAASGNVWSTARAVIEYKNDADQRKNGGVQYVDEIGNMAVDEILSGQTDQMNPGNKFTEGNKSPVKYINKIGNLFTAQTLQNNI
jgi:hypothetical protein